MTTDEVTVSKRPLTGKQRAFIDHYLSEEVAFNATEAARLAGYSADSRHNLEVQGYDNLRHPEIKREIEQRIAASRLSREYVITGLINVAERATADSAYGAATSALRELGRILAMFTDRTEIDIRAQVLAVSAELGLEPAELEAEVKRLSEGK